MTHQMNLSDDRVDIFMASDDFYTYLGGIYKAFCLSEVQSSYSKIRNIVGDRLISQELSTISETTRFSLSIKMTTAHGRYLLIYAFDLAARSRQLLESLVGICTAKHNLIPITREEIHTRVSLPTNLIVNTYAGDTENSFHLFEEHSSYGIVTKLLPVPKDHRTSLRKQRSGLAGVLVFHDDK